eukprot:3520360-Rhodomonas_salina.3
MESFVIKSRVCDWEAAVEVWTLSLSLSSSNLNPQPSTLNPRPSTQDPPCMLWQACRRVCLAWQCRCSVVLFVACYAASGTDTVCGRRIANA